MTPGSARRAAFTGTDAPCRMEAALTLFCDNDPFVCEWLRELVNAGELDGEVRCEDITEPGDHDGARCTHFFAGIGGWELALRWAGWPDDLPVWTGSCPCQPFSSAGKRKGTDDERHLWPAFLSLIAEYRPPVVFGEQVASKAGRVWLAGVRADLEALGYGVGAAMCAAGVGAPHIRQRIWWVADTERCVERREKPCRGSAGRVGRFIQPLSWNGGWQAALAGFRTVDDGLPRCVAGNDAARNAIVPQVAAAFVRSYMEAVGMARTEAAACG